jgi:hypothetical protein
MGPDSTMIGILLSCWLYTHINKLETIVLSDFYVPQNISSKFIAHNLASHIFKTVELLCLLRCLLLAISLTSLIDLNFTKLALGNCSLLVFRVYSENVYTMLGGASRDVGCMVYG